VYKMTVSPKAVPAGLPVSIKAFKIAESLMGDLTDGRENWKFPTKTHKTTVGKLASEIAMTLNYYLGGSEIKTSVDEIYDEVYSVSSLGYYHYIGA
tara:strand:+ start:1469 stop:1756 length:288 start_codon:yes stop_codon:yes gene_type:complete